MDGAESSAAAVNNPVNDTVDKQGTRAFSLQWLPFLVDTGQKTIRGGAAGTSGKPQPKIS